MADELKMKFKLLSHQSK